MPEPSATSRPRCSRAAPASSSPNIPYKGNGNAIADLMGGHVSMMFLSILPVIGQIQAGTLNALAVASPARSSLIPKRADDRRRSGVPGFSAVITYGLAAPAGTPRADRRAAEQGTAGRARRAGLRSDSISKAARCCRARRRTTPTPSTREEKKWGPLVEEPQPQGRFERIEHGTKSTAATMASMRATLRCSGPRLPPVLARAQSDPVADFSAGKTVNMFIGVGVGGE